MKNLVSKKSLQFTESVIREMTRLNNRYGGINLAQGFPDFAAPQEMKNAACKAVQDDVNQYAITWGAKSFRDAIAQKTRNFLGMKIDPETEITVCCGATEAMISAFMAVIDPGDEVVVFEPFYENYGPDAILSDAVPRFVTLHEPDWHFDEKQLEKAFTNKTKVIVINTPNNPTGKVFSKHELEFISKLCQKWNVIAITDEIYEHILYDGERHIAIATLNGMRDRTITVNGCSKTFSVTGWRLGYCIASPEMTDAIRKVHDFLTVGAAAPLQEAGAYALGFGNEYYKKLAEDYAERRDYMLAQLEAAGFRYFKPKGAYYVMTDISSFGFEDDVKFAHHLVKEIGVATVPGSSFYNNPEDGKNRLRFSFCKEMETLKLAGERLRKLGDSG